MRIIKTPEYITETIKCDCGCIFEVNIEDLRIVDYFERNERIGYVGCPVCHQIHGIDISKWGNGYKKEESKDE